MYTYTLLRRSRTFISYSQRGQQPSNIKSINLESHNPLTSNFKWVKINITSYLLIYLVYLVYIYGVVPDASYCPMCWEIMMNKLIGREWWKHFLSKENQTELG